MGRADLRGRAGGTLSWLGGQYGSKSAQHSNGEAERQAAHYRKEPPQQKDNRTPILNHHSYRQKRTTFPAITTPLCEPHASAPPRSGDWQLY